LPNATIILGCWMKETDTAALEQLRDGAKADLIAASLGEALKLCIEVAGANSGGQIATKQDEASAKSAA
jgi:hypothetical protein